SSDRATISLGGNIIGRASPHRPRGPMGGGEWEQVLLGRLAWVRGVIARHVPQRESAEDLVQEVLAAAIARPPGSANGPRAECIDRWLRGLALNQVRM